jgi:hypothetical protein
MFFGAKLKRSTYGDKPAETLAESLPILIDQRH